MKYDNIIHDSILLPRVNCGLLGLQDIEVEYSMHELCDLHRKQHERSHDIGITGYYINSIDVSHLVRDDRHCPLRRAALALIQCEHGYKDWSL